MSEDSATPEFHVPTFKFLREESDNCRTYYRGSKGGLYCIQDDGAFGRKDFKLYRCSEDGEPSHAVTWGDNYRFDRLVYPS